MQRSAMRTCFVTCAQLRSTRATKFGPWTVRNLADRHDESNRFLVDSRATQQGDRNAGLVLPSRVQAHRQASVLARDCATDHSDRDAPAGVESLWPGAFPLACPRHAARECGRRSSGTALSV